MKKGVTKFFSGGYGAGEDVESACGGFWHPQKD